MSCPWWQQKHIKLPWRTEKIQFIHTNTILHATCVHNELAAMRNGGCSCKCRCCRSLAWPLLKLFNAFNVKTLFFQQCSSTVPVSTTKLLLQFARWTLNAHWIHCQTILHFNYDFYLLEKAVLADSSNRAMWDDCGACRDWPLNA